MRGSQRKEDATMKKAITTGIQDFESLRVNDRFYVDKTDFIPLP